MRAMSLNLFGQDGDWPARRELLAAELLGPDYHLAHQTLGLLRDASSMWFWTGRASLEGTSTAYRLVRCGDHGPTLRVVDCRLALDEPVGGVMASDHYGVVADLQARDPGQR